MYMPPEHCLLALCREKNKGKIRMLHVNGHVKLCRCELGWELFGGI